MLPNRSLSTFKPPQNDQHAVHPVLVDEKKCTVRYGAAKNLCLPDS